MTSVDAAGVVYDGNQNITGVGAPGQFGYDASNRLTDAAGGGAFSYDPAGRLYERSANASRYLYAGGQAIGRYDGSGAVVDRYVPGAGLDDYAGYVSAGGTRAWPVQDPLGSIAALVNGSGVATQINTYDEYGVPGPGFSGPFGYAGSMYLSEAGAAPWHMRNRQYHPGLGRFLQTDPIGYQGGMNLYAYVGGDPVNRHDPWGLCAVYIDGVACVDDIVVTGTRPDEGGRSQSRFNPFQFWDGSGRMFSGLGGANLHVASPEDTCNAEPGAYFETPEEAALAGGRAAERERLRDVPTRGQSPVLGEYFGSVVPLQGGGYTFTPPEFQRGATFQLRMPSNAAGWYHHHNVGGANSLSGYDRQVIRRFNNRNRPYPFATVLVDGDLNLRSWSGGQGVDQGGELHGAAQCPS